MSDLELIPDYPVLTGIGKLSGYFKLDTLPGGITYSDITIRAYYIDPLGGRFNGIQAAQVNCQSTGQWLIEGISESHRYNVVISIPGYNDIIYSNKATSDNTDDPQSPTEVGEAFVMYFSVAVNGGGFTEGQYVLVRHATDGIEHVIKLDGISRHDVSGASSCVSISPDGKHVAAYQGSGYSKILLVDVASGTHRSVDLSGNGVVGLAQPARPSLQFSGSTLYVLTEDGLFNIDLTAGEAQPIELGYLPNPDRMAIQTMSVSGSLMTLTQNRTTAGALPGTPPVLLYNTEGLFLPEQFALPTGSQLATTDVPIPSPFGAAGAFSPNGAYYALSVMIFFGDSPGEAAPGVRLVIYDVGTRAALHELVISDMDGYGNNVAWSKDSRYVVVTYDFGSANAGSVFDLQTNTLINFGVGNLANYPVVATNNGEILYSDRSFGADLQLLAFSSENGHSIGLPEWANMPDVSALPVGLASA